LALSFIGTLQAVSGNYGQEAEMGSGLTIQPATQVLQTSAVASSPAKAQHAVESDLSPAKSVQAAETVAPAHNEVARAEDLFRHDIIIDPQSREVIFRVIDVRSRQVVRQVPDAALLRLRAYARALADRSSAAAAEHRANVKA
jgi:uncharacterized FlaG/YvyC family protein